MILVIGLLVLLVKIHVVTSALLLTVALNLAPCFVESAAAGEGTGAAAERQPAPTRLLRRAGKKLQHHDYLRAQALFERALARAPQSLHAQLGLGSALYGLGRYKDALAVLDKAVAAAECGESKATGQTKSDLRKMRAKVDEELQRYDQAVADLSAALQAGGDCPDAYSCRATAFDALGYTDKAIADMSKALELDPHNAENFLSRALLYKGAGKNDLALADLNKAVEIDPQLVTWRASFQKDQGRTDEAIADFSQAIELKSGNDKAAQLFNRGTIYEDLDQHRKAIADFTAALAISPSEAELYAYRGTSYFGVSDFKRAIDDFSRAIALAGSNADYYFRRANAEVEDQQVEKALADFNTAVKLDDGKHACYLLKRADLESDIGNHGDAIADITKAIEISKGDPDYYFDRGMEYELSGQPKRSADDLSNCIKKRPEDPGAYKNRAIARMKLGDACGAMADLQHSARLYKDSGDRHGSAEVARLMQKVKQP